MNALTLTKLAQATQKTRTELYKSQESCLEKAEKDAIAKHIKIQEDMNTKLDRLDKVSEKIAINSLVAAHNRIEKSKKKVKELEQQDFNSMYFFSFIRAKCLQVIEAVDDFFAERIEKKVQAEKKEQKALQAFIKGVK